MATDWLPVKTIPIKSFRKNPPPGFSKVEVERGECYTYNGSFIYIYETKIGGLLVSQYNKNQGRYDVIHALEKHFGMKFIDYCSGPYDDHEYDYNVLHHREYPNQ